MVECLYCKSWMSVAKTLLKKKSVWMLLYKFSEISQNTDMCCFALFGTIWAILKTLKTPMEECYFEEALVRLLLSWRFVVNTFLWKKASVTMLSCKFSEISQNIFFFPKHRYLLLCTIWDRLYNLKNVKNTHGGVLLFVKLQVSACNCTKSITPPWMFFTCFRFHKCYQIVQSVLYVSAYVKSCIHISLGSY